MKRKILILVLLLTLLLVNAAQAMSSTNYRIDWLVPLTNGSGGAADSANYAVSYTVGQAAIGHSDSTNYDLSLGFWQEFLRRFFTWLPLTRVR